MASFILDHKTSSGNKKAKTEGKEEGMEHISLGGV